MRILAEADLLAVEADDEHALGGADVEHDPSSRPGRRHAEVAFVDARRVMFRDRRRQAGERHLDVGVVRVIPGVGHRPEARHVRLGPLGAGLVIGRPEQLEAPPAIERHALEVGNSVHRKTADPRQFRLGPRSRHETIVARTAIPGHDAFADATDAGGDRGSGWHDRSLEYRSRPRGYHPAMTRRATPAEWLIFLTLGFCWGSSYLFIKLAVDDFGTFTLVALRLLIGAGLLWTVVLLSRVELPRDPRVYGHLVVMATLNIALPFSLITWAEHSVDSSLASILTTPVPLFAAVLAPFFLPDEPLRVNGLVGLAVGVHRGGHPDQPGPVRIERRAGRRAGPARGGLQLRVRCHLRAAQRPRAAPDGAGRLPGHVRLPHRGSAGVPVRTPARGHAGRAGDLRDRLAGPAGLRARLPVLLPIDRTVGRDPRHDGRLSPAGRRDRPGLSRPGRDDRWPGDPRDDGDHGRDRHREQSIRSAPAVRPAIGRRGGSDWPRRWSRSPTAEPSETARPGPSAQATRRGQAGARPGR